MLMRKSKGQRTSGWSVLKFKNKLMSPPKGQRTSGFSQRGINEMRKAQRVGDPRIFKYANENISWTKEKTISSTEAKKFSAGY